MTHDGIEILEENRSSAIAVNGQNATDESLNTAVASRYGANRSDKLIYERLGGGSLW